MIMNIFVNLPVKDLNRSMEFFRNLGFVFNPQFTDDTAACMAISDNINAMLLTEKKFQGFIKNKEIADARKSAEVIIALSTDSREKTDTMVNKALAAGGNEVGTPQDYGFMYERSFGDPDGHIWTIYWMDPARADQDTVTSDPEQAKVA